MALLMQLKAAYQKLKDCLENALILYADIPLIELSSLKKVIKNVTKRRMSLLTFIKNEKNSYGKVILDQKGYVSSIIEQRELNNKEPHPICNSGVFSCDIDVLKNLISKINNKTNKKKEYYLTDIFNLAYKKNIETESIIVDEDEFME